MKSLLVCFVLVSLLPLEIAAAEPWTRHVIDDTSRGADGVRLADINGDDKLDIVTPWEEGHLIRVYFQPELAMLRQPWQKVTIGKVPSPEDAVAVDLNQDGSLDVVSCCEGKARSLQVHWSPTDTSQVANDIAWKTLELPIRNQSWMFCVPMDVDRQGATDLVVGSKGAGAGIGWIESPTVLGDQWTYHRICDAGWIMNMIARDMDGDGDQDIVASDRKGNQRGIFWLEHPNDDRQRTQPWRRHWIGARNRETMFFAIADVNQDGLDEVIVNTRQSDLELIRPTDGDTSGTKWQSQTIASPASIRNGKAVAVGDINLDGKPDLVINGDPKTNAGMLGGMAWLEIDALGKLIAVHDISGDAGTKFDLIELLDLDQDGDLDAITCEEVDNLGVIWYENPTR